VSRAPKCTFYRLYGIWNERELGLKGDQLELILGGDKVLVLRYERT